MTLSMACSLELTIDKGITRKLNLLEDLLTTESQSCAKVLDSSDGYCMDKYLSLV